MGKKAYKTENKCSVSILLRLAHFASIFVFHPLSLLNSGLFFLTRFEYFFFLLQLCVCVGKYLVTVAMIFVSSLNTPFSGGFETSDFGFWILDLNPLQYWDQKSTRREKKYSRNALVSALYTAMGKEERRKKHVFVNTNCIGSVHLRLGWQ